MVKNYLKVIGVFLLAAALFFGGRASAPVTFFGSSSTSLPNGLDVGGGTYASDPVFTVTGTSTFSAGITIGSSGSALQQFISGSCTLGTQGPSSIDASHAASTTKVYDCPITGVRPGDTIFASLATSTVAGNAGWAVAFAKASSTAGYAEIGITNWTGAAVVPSTQSVGSSTKVIIVR